MLKLTGLENLLANLRRVEEVTAKKSRQEMYKQGRKLRDHARWFSPVDEFNLEPSIVVKKEHEYRGRIALNVGVHEDGSDDLDSNLPKQNDSSVDVMEYAERVHDSMEPFGDMGRGPNTQAKGAQAGGGYMQRAFDELKPEMEAAMERAAKEAINEFD